MEYKDYNPVKFKDGDTLYAKGLNDMQDYIDLNNKLIAHIAQGNFVFIKKTSQEWGSDNETILFNGQLAFEVKEDNTLMIKMGDGTSKWANLPYFVNGDAIQKSEYLFLECGSAAENVE